MDYTPWTPEHDDIIQSLSAQGVSSRLIGAQIGRTKGAVIGRLARLRRDDAAREKDTRYKREWERTRRDQHRSIAVRAVKVEIPDDVLTSRAAYINAAPRDLTGAHFGDPPRGFSALDRRGA